jgi:GT2 family glycosyltransferase
MDITVVVTTYRRPEDLSRCLQGLKRQTRLADEVVVVARDTDTETWNFLESFNRENLPLRTATVVASGAIAAANVGLDEAKGDIISFIDDDAVPRNDWLARIEPYFLSDERVSGVGGRDFMYYENKLVEGSRKVVGKIQWFGRAIGNHHLGIGGSREVDVLKGVNMSFRRSAIANRHFDRNMRGTSAQIHFEIEFCLALKKAGWKLLYDPAIAVDHYLGKRFDEDRRNKFNEVALTNIVHNETLALLKHLSLARQIIFLIWAVLVGTREGRGIVQWLRFLPSEGTLAWRKLIASLQGRWQGWQTWKKSVIQASVEVFSSQ